MALTLGKYDDKVVGIFRHLRFPLGPHDYLNAHSNPMYLFILVSLPHLQ